MKLTKISAENLKGETFTLELADRTHIIGPNFNGKTARLDAIRLLLIGYIPELGKKPSSTFELCSGRELVVTGEFSDGSTARRRWYLNKNSVKTEEKLPAWLAEANAAHLSVMLDSSTYFSLGPTDQVRYVFDNVPLPNREPAAIMKKLREGLATIDRDEWPDLPPVGGKPFDPVEEFVNALQAREIEAEAERSREPWTPQTFVAWLLAEAASIEKNSRVKADVMGSTVQGLAHLRAADTKQPDLATLDARRADLTREVQSLFEKRAAAKGAAEAYQNAARRRQWIESQLANSPAYDSERAEMEIDAAKYEIDSMNAGSDAAADDAVMRSVGEVTSAMRVAERDLRDVAQSIDRNQRELAELTAKKSCPYCGSTGEGWKSIKVAEVTSALSGLRTKHAQLTEHLTKLGEHQAQLSKQTAEIANRRNAAGVVSQRVEKLKREMKAAEERDRANAALRAELAALPPVTGETEILAAFSNASSELDAKNKELNELDQQRRLAMARQNDIKRLAEAELARDRATIEAMVGKAAIGKLKEIQQEMVRDAFAPLLTTANRICGDILRGPLGYRDEEIGYWRDGQWISPRTFSGTEEALAYVSIQMALAAQSPIHIMMLDECGVIHSSLIPKIVTAVDAAIAAGIIDQFVGVDVERGTLYVGAPETSSMVIEL